MQEKDNSENGLFGDLFQMGKDPEAEEAFANELGAAMSNILDIYSALCNRIGVSGFWVEREETYYSIGIAITNGLVSILPFVPEEIRQRSAIRYAAEVEFAAQTYGEDPQDWPKEAMAGFAVDQALFITLRPSRIRKFKAEFSMEIYIAMQDWTAMVFTPLEQNVGFSAMPEMLMDWPRDPQKLTEKVSDFLASHILQPECWRTCRDRRIELFANFFSDFVSHALEMPAANDVVPKKCFTCIFWCFGDGHLACLENSPFLEQCRLINGNFLKPGSAAAFLMKFDLSVRQEGVQFSFYGPFATDPAANKPIIQIIKDLPEPLIRAVIPEAAIAAGSEFAQNEEQSPLQKAAIELGLELLEFMGATTWKQEAGSANPKTGI